MEKSDQTATENKVEEIVETLNIAVPENGQGESLPLGLKIVAAFTLIGGLSIVGSLFVDIGQPGASIDFKFYILRLIVGAFALGTVYGLIKKERWAMWVYGIVTIVGFVLNPITIIIPGAVLIYLYSIRSELKPSVADKFLAEVIKTFPTHR